MYLGQLLSGRDPKVLDFRARVDRLIKKLDRRETIVSVQTESRDSLSVSMAICRTILTFCQAIFITSPAILKVVVFLGIWLGLWLPFAIPRSIHIKWRPGLPLLPDQKLPLLASLYLLAPIVVGITAKLEKSNLSDYGVIWETATLADVSRGFAVGVLGLLFLFSLQFVLGAIEWTFPMGEWRKLSPSIPSGFSAFMFRSIALCLPTFLLALWVAGTEEIVFRGVLQNLLQPQYSLWEAAAIVSLIFALLHLIWESRETLPQIPGLWLMGMVLAWARIVDGGSIALAWGIHTGWVWGMISLDTAGIVRHTDKIPEWIGGISGKPLAGVLGIVLLLGTGAVLVRYQ
ncbi:MAG: CPBP family intramembrane glutamic endopeptidase [Geitlerinemataceae cyanobacterium]